MITSGDEGASDGQVRSPGAFLRTAASSTYGKHARGSLRSALLCATLNAVEDEHSGVTYDPPSWRTDGRFYPPQQDRVYAVDGFPGVLRYNSFKHNTYIANNGAIEVRIIATSEIQFTKPGANGKGVWE